MANGLSIYNATQITDKIKECGIRLDNEQTEMVINFIDCIAGNKLSDEEYISIYDIVMKLR